MGKGLEILKKNNFHKQINKRKWSKEGLERVGEMQKDNKFSASDANAMKLYASDRLTGITSALHS